MLTQPGLFDYERHSLRWVLKRLMGEERDLDTLCKHVPRLASVAANVARIEAALESGKDNDDIDALRKALRDLENTQPDEEDASW